jgi:ring-1,2-phenylacetyl-CoA epoxidase subunit PaaD
MVMQALMVTEEEVWDWLKAVPDPEIPVISIVDLGIVRAVAVDANGACTVTLTPTYSGCPAMEVIAQDVRGALRDRGVDEVTLVTRLSPAWTTDWLDAAAKEKLRGYGIAPPAQQVIDISGLHGDPLSRGAPALRIACPLCGSMRTQLTSRFGSTPCKALYKCLDCREPFDYFKCH